MKFLPKRIWIPERLNPFKLVLSLSSFCILASVFLIGSTTAVASYPAQFSVKDVSFSGHYRIGDINYFSLRCAKSDKSKWATLGEKFQNYTIESYDTETGALSLKKSSGQRARIYLNGGVQREADISRLNANNAASTTAPSASSDPALLRKFSSLSAQQQKDFFKPEFVPFLRSSNVEVPSDLLDQYEKMISANQSAKVSGSLGGQKRKHRGPSIPLVTTSRTVEEKKQRLLQLVK